MAGRRVYWKGLILVIRALISYINRNREGLTNNLDGPTMVCINALLDAAVVCADALPENNPA